MNILGPRVWQGMNRISLDIKPGLWTEPLNDDRSEFGSHFAVMYGPLMLVVLASKLSQKVHLCGDPNSPDLWLRRENAKMLRFTAETTGQVRVELLPLAHVVDQRYVAYPAVAICPQHRPGLMP